MFCPKCGSQLNDDAKFCPSCGEKTAVEQSAAEPVTQEVPAAEETVEETVVSEATVSEEPVTEAPEPKPKKVRKPLPKWFKPVALAAAVLIVALVVFLIIATNSKTTVKAALGGIDDAFTENEIIGSVFTAFQEYQLSVDVQQIYGPDGVGALTDPMKYDIYSDGNQGSAYFDFLGAKFDVHGVVDPMTFIINTDGGAYGFVFEGLKEAFRGSVFHPDSGSKYALDMNEEGLEMFEEFLDSYEKLLQQDSMEEMSDYYSEYGELFIDLMWEYGEQESESEGGNKIVTIKLDEKSLTKVVKDFIAELTADEDLIALLDERIPISMVAGEQTWMESWSDVMDMMKDSSKDLTDALKSADFELELAITASPIAHDLKAIDVKLSVDNVSLKAGIAFDGNNITLTVNMPGSKIVVALEETETGWTFYSKIAGEKMFEAEYEETDEGWTFALEAMGATLMDVEFETNDDTYEFYFSVYDVDSYDYYGSDSNQTPAFAIFCEGNYVEEKGGFSITIDELGVTTDGWTETVTMDARIAYYTEFDMPELPQYTDLLKADETAIDEMVATIEQFLTGAFGQGGTALPDAGIEF